MLLVLNLGNIDLFASVFTHATARNGVFNCSTNFGFKSFLVRTQVEGLLLTLTGVKICAICHPNTSSYSKQEAYERFARPIAACARLKL